MPAWPVRLAMFLRSFAIQGSWNYRTLIGSGFAFALLPALRARFRGARDELDAAAVCQTDVFNSHPYLVGVALGAVCRIEEEGGDPRVVDRFKAAVRGSLGGLGDSLFWAGLRPACGLLGITLVFAGSPWWLGPLVFLVVYNAGHLAARIWGFRVGFRHGRHVAEHLRKANLAETQQHIAQAGTFLLGLALPLMLAGGRPTALAWPWIAIGGALAVLAMRFGDAVRMPIAGAVGALLGIGLLLGLMQ
jgi:PTS system mannose-specific IID component